MLFNNVAPRIESVERFADGIIVDFANGISAVYPAEILCRLLDEVQIISSDQMD